VKAGISIGGIAILFLFIFGCLGSKGIDKEIRIDLDIPDTFQHSDRYEISSIGKSWWKDFGDRRLEELIDELLEKSWDIKRATLRIVELKNTLIKTHALRLPRLDLELLAKRQSQYVNRVVPKNFGLSFQKEREIVDIFTLSVPASYELDLWGRLSGAEDAVRAQILEAEENRKTIIQSLIAEAVSLYLQIKAKDEELRIEKERVKNYKKSLLLVESRFKRGLCDILELRQARRALAASEAMIPKLNEELGDLEQRLSILLGRYPKTGDFSKRSYWNYLKTLRPVPPGLPSQLLLRRPDIRAAQARLKALSAMVGVSRASRFPRITLTGNMGYASEELHRLFTPQSYLWSLAIGIIRPIFDGNRLKAEQKEAEIRYREGLTQYAETVLKAFYEVESALLRRKKLLERRERLFTLLKEARLTEEVAVSRYRRGLIDFLTVLEAKQKRFEAEQSLVRTELGILLTRISLIRALGGAWG